jgi:hypothetical protein
MEHSLVLNQEVLDKNLASEFQEAFVNEVACSNVDALINKMKDIEKAS